MLNLIKLLFHGHLHHWKIIEHIRAQKDGAIVRHIYHLQCETCGKVKGETICN